MASRLRKIRRVAAQLSQANGLDPLPEQIAEAAHIDLDEVIHLLSLIEQPVSLDTPVDDEARYSLAFHSMLPHHYHRWYFTRSQQLGNSV